MKKIIISIAFLLSTAAQAMEGDADKGRQFNTDFDSIKKHMVSAQDQFFLDSQNLFFGIDAQGMNLNDNGAKQSANPSQSHIFSEPVGLLGLLFSQAIITEERFNPEAFKNAFKHRDICKLEQLNPNNLKFINTTVRKTNTIVSTEYKFTNPTRDLLKLAAFTAAGIGIYAYFKRQ